MLYQILYLAQFVLSVAVHISTANGSGKEVVKLQKCNGNDRYNGNNGNESWVVPSWLRAPFSDKKIRLLQDLNADLGSNVSEKLFTFELFNSEDRHSFNCGNQFKTKTFYLAEQNVPSQIRDVNHIDRTQLYHIPEYGFIMPNGYLQFTKYSIPADMYCISRIINRDEIIQIKVCLPDDDLAKDERSIKNIGEKVIVNKCCPIGTVVQMDVGGELGKPICHEEIGSEEWTPTIYKQITRTFDYSYVPVDEDMKNKFYFFRNLPNCDLKPGMEYHWLTPNRATKLSFLSEFRIRTSESVVSRLSGNHNWGRPKTNENTDLQDFCIDGLVDNSLESGVYDAKDPKNQILLFCDKPDVQKKISAYRMLYFSMFCVSLIFLIPTVIIFGLIWPTQTIHGWTVTMFTASMCFFFIFAAITAGVGIFPQTSNIFSSASAPCISIAVLGHFFFIANFTWMAILNFDLYTTIRSMKPRGNEQKNKTRFMWYCAIGYGIPTIIVSFALIVDTQVDYFDDSITRPQYGIRACRFDTTSQKYYAYLPITIAFVVNAALGILTIKFLYDFKKITKLLQEGKLKGITNNTDADEYLYNERIKIAKLFAKCFALSGISWIFEVLFPVVTDPDTTSWYWAVTDICNSIQPIGLFWIFICKKEVKDQLCSQYRLFEYLFKKLKSIRQDFSKGSTVTDISNPKAQVTLHPINHGAFALK